MARRLRVFVSCSFDASDKELIQCFLSVLRQNRFHAEVRTAERHEARSIADKIKEGIRWADVTIGIFTRKFQIVDESGNASYVPPPYVMSECSFAFGLYDGSSRTVHGFVEDGIDYKRIGLNVAEGQEFPTFNRADVLKGNVKRIGAYVQDIRKRHLESAQNSHYPYIQQFVHKTVYVYRDGSALFKNTVKIFIRDASRVSDGIPHSIWLPQNSEASFPSFYSMCGGYVSHHVAKPVFFAVLLKVGGKEKELPITMSETHRSEKEIRFLLKFPLKLKDHDTLEYQYVWGIPRVFPPFEEDMKSHGDAYQEIALRAHYGEIRDAVLKVRFERNNTYGVIPEIFSKRPYVLFTPSSRDGDDSLVEAVDPGSLSRDAAFETYEHSCEDLSGGMAMRWGPISRRRYKTMVRSEDSPASVRGRSARKKLP